MSVKRQIILSGNELESSMGFAQASRVDDFICVSGTGPCDEKGQTVYQGDIYLQAQTCFEIALESVLQCGGSIEDVIRTRIYAVNRDNIPLIAKAHKEFFGMVQPASSILIVNQLIDSEWLVQVEIDAYVKPQ